MRFTSIKVLDLVDLILILNNWDPQTSLEE
jgi:hypothetical protein